MSAMIALLASRLGMSKLAFGAVSVVVCVSLIIGAIALIRADAVSDDRAEREAARNQERIEDIDDAKRRRNDVQELDDNSLAGRLRQLLTE